MPIARLKSLALVLAAITLLAVSGSVKAQSGAVSFSTVAIGQTSSAQPVTLNFTSTGTLATELAPHKITVNCVRPGATFTELTLPMYTDIVKKALFMRIPLKEIAEASWIADGVVFLASERARYITGQILAIDGGYLMDGSLPGAEYWK